MRVYFVGIWLLYTLMGSVSAWATSFPIVTKSERVTIAYDPRGPKLDSISAHLLALDIERVTTVKPKVVTSLLDVRGNLIAIGSVESALVQQLLGSRSGLMGTLRGGWERFGLTVVANPLATVPKALVVAGSDARGTAYGVFAVSEKLGVSPWYWWADVTPKQQKTLTLDIRDVVSETPSVKFRGIFINDEDWGLQPWAAKTFEPETKDIGPKTYAKVFELLLRLRANLIWPGMHPSTKPFYTIPGNKEMADAYQIVVGSSHAEPMLRNNVGEWDKKTMGAFNYLTNKPAVYGYWESRVKQAGVNNVMYTIGMRGVHDSGMEGVKNPKEAVPLLEQIFADQRGLFQKYINPNPASVPQVFTLYKEVLDVYANGLNVPDDVTLIWPDDNYGYIHQLSNAQEVRRQGGSGVYYHASYWGRPHDYLWLSTTHPALMREEMTKAYTMNARQLWVLNVGDIKPGEYATQLFMDMAYRIEPFMESRYTQQHLRDWTGRLFGEALFAPIANSLWDYYGLAFERKPEYMGWSQTEPTTSVKSLTAYNHFFFGDQGQRRLQAYDAIEKAVRAIHSRVPEPLRNAFYQLVEYPVVGASLMNKKFLYRDKAYLYAGQGRLSARHYADLSKQAYEGIVRETDHFNNELAGGKWRGMMSMKPRDLPVFSLPKTEFSPTATGPDWQVIPEGNARPDSASNVPPALPSFDRWNKQTYFVDVFLCRETSLSFQVIPSADWIRVNQVQGMLSPADSDRRLRVRIDWAKAPKQLLTGSVRIEGGNRAITINLTADNRDRPELQQYTGFVEGAGYVAIDAASTSARTNGRGGRWGVVDGLGTSGKALEALPLQALPTTPLGDTTQLRSNASVTYAFYTVKPASADISIYTLPTFPLTGEQEMRYAVSLDGGALTVLNFKTVGRTEEWKQNVLSNAAVRSIKQAALPAGKHTLTIYKIDSGVILDRIFIDLGTGQPRYGAVPEMVFHAPQ